MTAVWEVGPEAAAAQLAATIARADQGAGVCLRCAFTPRRSLPHCGAAHRHTWAEVVLLKPCAAIVDGALVMYPRNVDGTLVMSTGLPRAGLIG